MSNATAGTRPAGAGAAVCASPGRRTTLRLPAARTWRLVAAAVTGLVASAAFPPVGAWPLSIVALAGLLVLCRDQEARTGVMLGLAHGLGFFLPLLHWSGIYVGVLPWLLLAALEASFLAAYGGLAPLAWRLPVAPVFLAALWTAVEALRSRVPFGGFPWGRLAFASADSPLVPLSAVGGAPLVGFAVAAAAALLASAVVGGGSGRRRALEVTTAAALVLVGLLVPTPGDSPRSAVVAVVQGNVPRPGLEFNAERERVLRNHVETTRALAAQVEAGEQSRPDLVIWPENASDVDPFRSPEAARLIQSATDAIGAPVLVGAVVDGPRRSLRNMGVVWRPGSGPGERYVKRHPAPFGEYVPLRSLARRVSDKVDLVARDFVAGHSARTLPMGPATVADVICFEVAYDGLVRDVVRADGDLLVVQTNNATFGYSAESSQQLAMTRLRAIEHGRATVQASTVGVSGIVRPDGSLISTSELFTRAVLVARVPLRNGRTVADRVGGWPEVAICLLALSGLALVVVRRRGA